MIRIKAKGDFSKSTTFLERLREFIHKGNLDKYGQMGVEALRAATPKDTGKTSESWDYEIVHENGKVSIYWTNSNTNKNVNIAVILQYGHGTRQGGYVQGIDYINPAMKVVFDQIAEKSWKEVMSI